MFSILSNLEHLYQLCPDRNLANIDNQEIRTLSHTSTWEGKTFLHGELFCPFDTLSTLCPVIAGFSASVIVEDAK